MSGTLEVCNQHTKQTKIRFLLFLSLSLPWVLCADRAQPTILKWMKSHFDSLCLIPNTTPSRFNFRFHTLYQTGQIIIELWKYACIEMCSLSQLSRRIENKNIPFEPSYLLLLFEGNVKYACSLHCFCKNSLFATSVFDVFTIFVSENNYFIYLQKKRRKSWHVFHLAISIWICCSTRIVEYASNAHGNVLRNIGRDNLSRLV